MWAGLAVILSVLIFSAYSKLNPESFLVFLNREVQRNYPGSKLTVTNIDYAFKLDFSLRIKELTVKKEETLMGRIGAVEIRLPWWLLLFNRGSAQVNLADVDVYLPEVNDPTSFAKDLEPSGGKLKVTVPGYMVNARYTLRAKDITIRDLAGNRRFFSISKLLVREFKYGSNSAFELNIPIHINHKDTSYNSELWLFGDVTPELAHWNLNYRGEFKTKENTEKLEFDDLVIDGKARIEPDSKIRSDYNLVVEKKEIGKGRMSYSGNHVNITATFSHFPLQYLSLIGDDIKNPFWGGLDGHAKGDLRFARKLGKEASTTLSGKLNFPGKFHLPELEPIQGNWQLNFENGKWETSFLSPKHEISFYRRAAVNFRRGTVSQYSQEIGFTGVDVKLPFLAVEDLGMLMNASPQDYHSTFVKIQNCTSETLNINGFFRLGILPDHRYYQTELAEGDNKLLLNYENKADQHQFFAEFKTFKFTESHRYLKPFWTAFSGSVDGKLEGKWQGRWMDGTWLGKLKFSGISRPQGSWFEFFNKLGSVFSFDTSQFPDQLVDGNLTKQNFKLNSYTLEGSDPAVISGVLSMNSKKSYLVLNHPKNKKWKPVRKDTGESLEPKETP